MQTESPTEKEFEVYQAFRIEGHAKSVVAERFAISSPTVYRWSVKVAEWMKAESREAVDKMRAELTARHEYIYRSAVGGFRQSQADQVVKTERNEGDKFVQITQTTNQAGTPAFLSAATKSLECLARLWEADMISAERRSDVRSVGKTQVQLIDDQLERLRVMKAKLTAVPGGGAGDRA